MVKWTSVQALEAEKTSKTKWELNCGTPCSYAIVCEPLDQYSDLSGLGCLTPTRAKEENPDFPGILNWNMFRTDIDMCHYVTSSWCQTSFTIEVSLLCKTNYSITTCHWYSGYVDTFARQKQASLWITWFISYHGSICADAEPLGPFSILISECRAVGPFWKPLTNDSP